MQGYSKGGVGTSLTVLFNWIVEASMQGYRKAVMGPLFRSIILAM
jgi:hypothetical protein